jgi:hypothetical protein
MNSLSFSFKAACIFCLFYLAFSVTHCFGQISPPGVEGANTASWSAIALSQHFGKRWSTVVYVGFETQSHPNTLNPFQNHAITVFNQETSYKFLTYWQLALCTSLRNQSIYEEDEPYELNSPSLRRELRWYSRLFYKRQVGKAAVACSFRPEYRRFMPLIGRAGLLLHNGDSGLKYSLPGP